MSVTRPGLAAFNDAGRPTRPARRLLTCLDVPRLGRRGARRAALRRPRRGRGADGARRRRPLTDDELEQALARHPRIGERADAARHDAAHSTREQAGVDRDDADVAAALAEGNRAYEERFDRVFIIRAAGRDAPEILSELRRRLDNTDEAERAETVDQLMQIARAPGPGGAVLMATLSTHVLDTAAGRPAAGLRVALESAAGDRAGRGRHRRRRPGARPGPRATWPPATYRLRFDTGGWFAARGETAFYPEVVVAFTVAGDDHLHVPLLLSPFGYSTYRGS